MKKYILSFLIGGMLSFTSCADYLNVSDELADELTQEEIFNTVKYARGWHGNIFNCISEYSRMFGVTTEFQNPWACLSGEISSCHAVTMTEPVNGYNATNASFQRFNSLYMYIRQAYIFLDKAHAIGNESDTEVLLSNEVTRMKSEAKFLIAYSYFSLFELYGPTPIIDYAADPSQTSFNFPRPSVDEMVKFIDDLYQEVLDEDVLPRTAKHWFSDGEKHDTWNLNEIARPTRAVVLAMRAKLWVYAASPLFNGGYREAMELRNEDGKQLFPAEDRNKWKIAKQHLEKFLSFAEEEGYELFKVKDAGGNINASESVYRLFQEYNDEIIWANGNSGMNSDNDGVGQRRCRPRDLFDGFSGLGVSQQMVDAFFTKNGLGIDQDPEYNESGFTDIENPCTYKANASTPNRIDKHVFNMYVNREPRFYWSVTYTGKSWHIQPKATPNWTFNAAKGGNNDNSNAARAHYTGYLLYKRCNNTLFPQSPYQNNFARPNILLRLADFYLYYAEACNEVNPNDKNVIIYLDKVRERAGIPGYQELKDMNVKDKNGNTVNIIGDYNKQAYAIRKERQVELFTEGQRYFDIHRWMICDPGEEADQSKFIGMNLEGNLTATPGSDESFFRRVNARSYTWRRSMYLYPIPHNEVSKSPLMKQNPLW